MKKKKEKLCCLTNCHLGADINGSVCNKILNSIVEQIYDLQKTEKFILICRFSYFLLIVQYPNPVWTISYVTTLDGTSFRTSKTSFKTHFRLLMAIEKSISDWNDESIRSEHLGHNKNINEFRHPETSKDIWKNEKISWVQIFLR